MLLNLEELDESCCSRVCSRRGSSASDIGGRIIVVLASWLR